MLTITSLLDENRCYEEIRNLRWPEQIICPHCHSDSVVKKGHHSHQIARQRYQCNTCHKRFDDLTKTVFSGHHQPLPVWVLCLYLMGLNLSNTQIAQELDLNVSDAQAMCQSLREMIDKKNDTHSKRRS